MGILSSCNHVSTTVWLHHLDFNKTLGEKARWKLLKDTACCFGLVLWHINHCRLFNAQSSLYIYIKYIWFGLVGFYCISTIIGYSMSNPLYTYILDMICKHILLITFSNKCELIFLHTVKWFQVLLSTTNSSIIHQSFVFTQLND